MILYDASDCLVLLPVQILRSLILGALILHALILDDASDCLILLPGIHNGYMNIQALRVAIFHGDSDDPDTLPGNHFGCMNIGPSVDDQAVSLSDDGTTIIIDFFSSFLFFLFSFYRHSTRHTLHLHFNPD